MFDNDRLTEYEDVLQFMFGISNDTLNIIECINGRNYQTLCDVLYAESGLRDFSQVETLFETRWED